MLDWLIVGGGLHGRFIADALARAAPAAEIAVLDPRNTLDAWRRRAAACGMTYLRSPSAHHLGARADALRRFASARGYDATHQLGTYRRPSRALFEAHVDSLTPGAPRISAHAKAIGRSGDHWLVTTDTAGALAARRVVLAPGPNAPRRPAALRGAPHVYDADFDAASAGQRVLVIGGGITGAQLALRLNDLGRAVCWLTRAVPRRTHFDSNPCYAGPKCLAPFARAPRNRRTALIAAARRPGTLPPDVYARITAALAAGEIAWVRGEIEAMNDAGVRQADGRRVIADRVVLATGFEAFPAPGGLLARCLDATRTPIDTAGHAYVNTDLEIAPGLHLAGRPASLELGPMAGNIRGARLAGARLAAVAGRDRYRAAG